MIKRELCALPLLAAALAGCGGDAVVDPGETDVVLVATVPVAPLYGQHDQFVRDGIAFLASWNTGLQIYDVGGGTLGGSPSSPQRIGGVVTQSNGVSGGPAVHNAWWYHAPDGQRRYVFVGQEGPSSGGLLTGSSGDIHVVDVSDMTAPVEVAFFHLDGLGAPRDSAGAHNFWVDEVNEILYAAFYNGGVVALDISGTLSGDLASREIARLRPGGPTNTYTWGVQLVGNSLYATDMLSGLWQLRLTGTTLEVVGGGNNVADRYSSDLWVSHGYAYSGTWGSLSRNGRTGNAIKVWSVAGSGLPVLADSIIIPGVQTVSDVEVSADGALLLASAEGGAGGLYLYDLAADREQPPLVASYSVGPGLHTATFADIGGRRYVFAARNPPSPAMLILDVTDVLP